MTGPTSSAQGLDHAPSIDCHEVREALGAPPRGMSLTECALVLDHVARCPVCQKEQESLQLAAISQRVEPAQPGAKLIEHSRALVISTVRHVTPSARPVAISIERARLVIARVPLLVGRLRSPLAIAVHGTARGAREAAGAGAARALDLVSRVGVLAATSLTAATRTGATLIESTGAAVAGVGRRMPSLVTPSVRAAGHGVGRARLAITRVPHAVIQLRSSVIGGLRGPARAAGQAAGAGVARVLGVLDRLAVVAPVLARSAARAIAARPRAYAAIAGLAVLVPSLLFLWPRQGLDDLGSRFSGRERTSREISVPVARTPVGPAAPVPFAVTSPPRPGAGAPPPPVAAARPETSLVTGSRTQAEIPAPVRRRATASAPAAAVDAPQSAETSDPAAAIDWLLKGSKSRRQSESP
jgi:hypothetical protein